MKRAQISTHRLIWLLMAPILAAVIFISFQARPTVEQTTNDELPAFLIQD